MMYYLINPEYTMALPLTSYSGKDIPWEGEMWDALYTCARKTYNALDEIDIHTPQGWKVSSIINQAKIVTDGEMSEYVEHTKYIKDKEEKTAGYKSSKYGYCPHSDQTKATCPKCGGDLFTSYPQSIVTSAPYWCFEYACKNCGHTLGIEIERRNRE